MKKYLLSIIAMFLMGFIAVGQVTIYEDNFDSYTAGEKLTIENPENWTTWSNAPGGPEDPVISTDYSFTNPNSVKITTDNDVVLLLGGKTVGKYNLGFKMYIPAGNLGYFNVLQDFAGSGSTWGLQVYFDLGGAGSIDGDGAGAASFVFGYDQWLNLKVFVDLDNDWCKVFLNNSQIHEYQWSKGTFGTGMLKLDGMDFYGWDDGGTPLFYVDDVYYEMVTESLIVEDFESYNAGQHLVQQAIAQGKDYWTTWNNSPGSAEDPMVSSDHSVSGSKSVLIEGTNDVVLLFNDLVTGAYAIEFNAYIPQGFYGYFNILQDFNGPSSEWGMQAFFDQGGLGTVDAGGQGAGVFTYAYDTWIPVKIDVDLNNDFAELFVNGNSVVTWVWSGGVFGQGALNKLDAFSMYAWNENGTPKAYFDDISLTQTAPPGGDPEINVSPTSFTETLQNGQTSQKTLTISNTGVVKLNYNIIVNFDVDDGDAETEYTQEVVIEPETTITGNDIAVIKAEKSQPGPSVTDDEVLLHYDGDYNSAVGLTNGGTFEIAARFPAALTGQYLGMELTQVRVYINDPANGYKIKIYGQSHPDKPGELLYEQLFSANAGAWNEVNLYTPLLNTGGDMWVAYEIVQNVAGVYPAGTDAGPAHADGDWIKTGSTWAKLSVINPNINQNWNIRAKLVGDPMQAWLSVDPSFGSIEPNMSESITVNFNAGSLPEGTYQANINIASNDPVTPLVSVPVTLNVQGGGCPLPPPTNLTLQQTGTNPYNVVLNWVAPEEPGGTIRWDDGINYDGIGLTNGGTFSVAAKWEPGQLTEYIGLYLKQVDLFPRSATATYVVKVWTGTAGNQQLVSQTATLISEQWNTVTITNPVKINAGMYLYIGYETTHGAGEFPAGADAGPAVANFGDLISTGGAWASMSIQFGLNYNWNIAGIIGVGSDNATPAEPIVITPKPGASYGLPIAGNLGKTNNAQWVNNSRALEGYDIMRDGQIIGSVGSTVTTYTDNNVPLGAHTYKVGAHYTECTAWSDPASIGVSISEPTENINTLSIYPNPANGEVNISSPTDMKQLKIINYTGQVVYQSQPNNNHIIIKIADLSAGMYLVQIETTEGWATSKLVIK